MHCDENPRVFVTVKIEGMCAEHATDLKDGIAKTCDYVIRSYMAQRGGRAESIPAVDPSETQH